MLPRTILHCNQTLIPLTYSLEHLGDTVLNMVITNYLQQVYPYLRVGPSTVRHFLLAASVLMYELNVLA